MVNHSESRLITESFDICGSDSSLKVRTINQLTKNKLQLIFSADKMHKKPKKFCQKNLCGKIPFFNEYFI